MTGGGMTMRLLQDVEVFAVDQNPDAPEGIKTLGKEMRSVTLIVTADQDLKLALAASRGTLQLSLRNSGDHDVAENRPIKMFDINMMAEKPKVKEPPKEAEAAPVKPVAAAPKRPAQIEMIRGNYQGGSISILPLEPLEPVSREPQRPN